MKIALLLLMALVTGCGCATTPPQASSSVALRLDFDNGVCSGTAIGHDEILSAAHCFVDGGTLVSVNNIPVTAFKVGASKGDVIRVRVVGPVFKKWATKFGVARQGERITWRGNPLAVPNVLRMGYVAVVEPEGILLDASTCVGDSGSGVFNERGEIIGVVSKIPTPKCSPFVLVTPV